MEMGKNAHRGMSCAQFHSKNRSIDVSRTTQYLWIISRVFHSMMIKCSCLPHKNHSFSFPLCGCCLCYSGTRSERLSSKYAIQNAADLTFSYVSSKFETGNAADSIQC